jgi:carbon-monoxide dehydrogenase small subunit
MCVAKEKGTPDASWRPISMTVNGKKYTELAEPRMSLLDFLRDKVNMTGVRSNCEHGTCGVCTILLNGQAIRSCLMLAVQAEGQQIVTVEGIAKGKELHPIQQGLWEEHGLQCGQCSAGIIMSIYELLGANPDPSDEEIYDVLGGHICRCTGYQQIYNSVKRAAELLRGV